MCAKLCVNVDHVATVRQARMIDRPDPLYAAVLAEEAGACGITIHLREDRRHIQDKDVSRIKKSIKTKLNLEMAPVDQIIEIALKTAPFQVTFVPEKRREITTEGGLNIIRGTRKLRAVIKKFQAKKILVSLFIDPDPVMIKTALDIGADAVELNTGAYSEATTKRALKSELGKIVKGARLCGELGMTIHAGHGLNLENVAPIVAIGNVEELNIGHSIVGRAIMVGIKKAVEEMIETISGRK